MLQFSQFTTTPIIMNCPYLTKSQIEELNEFGIIELTDELMKAINQWADEDSESNLDEIHTQSSHLVEIHTQSSSRSHTHSHRDSHHATHI